MRLYVADELVDRGHALLHRLGEGRRRRGAERTFEAPRRGADAVEEAGLCEPRRRADHPLQLEGCLLGLLDALRVLGQPDGDKLLAELLEIASAGGLLGELGQRDDRRGSADHLAPRDRLARVVEDEPGALVAVGEGAEVGPLVGLSEARDDADQLLAVARVRSGGGRDAVEILSEPHEASLDSPRGAFVEAETGRTGALFAARAEL